MATRTSSPPGSRSRSTSSPAVSKTSRQRDEVARAPDPGVPGRPPARIPARAPAARGTGDQPAYHGAPGASRGAQRHRAGRPHLPGAVPRRRRRCGSPWPTPSGPQPAGSGAARATSSPSTVATAPGLFLIGARASWPRRPCGSACPAASWTLARTVVVGLVGKVGWLVPLALVLGGLAHDARPREATGPAGRQAVGWTALSLGVLGIVHIAAGNPQPVGGDTTPLREGGGAVGYVVSSLLLDLLRSGDVVVPLLVLMAFFGVLVVTATPLYRVPERLADAARLRARPAAARRGRPDVTAGRSARAIDDTDRSRPGRPGLRHPGAGGPRGPHATRRRSRLRRRATRPTPRPSTLEHDEEPMPGARRWGRTTRRSSSSRRRTPRSPPRVEQLALSGDIVYSLPANEVLKPGSPHKARSKASDAVVERLTQVLERVQHRRPGHRLHPRPDRHPLRGRARAGGQGREGHRAVQEHRLRRRLGRRPDPQPDPRQVRDRHRDPQRRQGDRLPGRRAALGHGPRRPPPDGLPGSARTSRAASSSPTSPRCRTCSSPAPPARASRASSTR